MAAHKGFWCERHHHLNESLYMIRRSRISSIYSTGNEMPAGSPGERFCLASFAASRQEQSRQLCVQAAPDPSTCKPPPAPLPNQMDFSQLWIFEKTWAYSLLSMLVKCRALPCLAYFVLTWFPVSLDGKRRKHSRHQPVSWAFPSHHLPPYYSAGNAIYFPDTVQTHKISWLRTMFKR